jgi:hypothetical protein
MAREPTHWNPAQPQKRYLTTASPHISIGFHPETSLSPTILEPSVWVKLNCSELFSSNLVNEMPSEARRSSFSNHHQPHGHDDYRDLLHPPRRRISYVLPEKQKRKFQDGYVLFLKCIGFDVPVKGGTDGARDTSGCRNSWRNTGFQCTITHGTFVKRRATAF